MKKNGSSHLDFVLSFTIFILFVIFMYSVIQPSLGTSSNKDSLVSSLRLNLLKDSYTEKITITTLVLPDSRRSDCVEITGGSFYEEFHGVSLRIKDDKGNTLNYNQGEMKIKANQDYNGILKIYNGTEVVPSPTFSDSSCDDARIDAGTVKSYSDKLFLTNLFALVIAFNVDCGATLKGNFDFLSSSDFTFSFLPAIGGIIQPTCAKIPATNVYSQEYPVQYFDENLNLQAGKMTIKLW